VRLGVFLIDTNVISEARKGARAHPGVRQFFARAAMDDTALYLSAVTVGELRRGVELIRYRGDTAQAALLEQWLSGVLQEYADRVLPFDVEAAQVGSMPFGVERPVLTWQQPVRTGWSVDA
jgi:predicted nucleic acid-binding protein